MPKYEIDATYNSIIPNGIFFFCHKVVDKVLKMTLMVLIFAAPV